MFQPRYLKKAKLLDRGIAKFLRYKRDVLPTETVATIEDLRDHLAKAIKAKDPDAIRSIEEVANRTCAQAAPEDTKNLALRENLEVIFVAVVIAVGLRSYVAQPFKIPTGSMEPTLNGIVGTDLIDDPSYQLPSPPARWLSSLLLGKRHIDLAAAHSGRIVSLSASTSLPLLERFNIHTIPFISASYIGWDTTGDGQPDRRQRVPIEPNILERDLGLASRARLSRLPGGQTTFDPEGRAIQLGDRRSSAPIEKGEPLARGFAVRGDSIFVNKIAYHFRKPQRGEVFVFSTRDVIPPDDPRVGSQHYIKRLVGTPGDVVSIYVAGDGSPGQLYIGTSPAAEFGIARTVESASGSRYHGYTIPATSPIFARWRTAPQTDLGPGTQVSRGTGQGESSRSGTLAMPLADDEFLALGDNSANSYDGRNWGPVPRRNLVGPAFMVFWPFGDHWGQIR
jgi:signal peptidase I